MLGTIGPRHPREIADDRFVIHQGVEFLPVLGPTGPQEQPFTANEHALSPSSAPPFDQVTVCQIRKIIALARFPDRALATSHDKAMSIDNSCIRIAANSSAKKMPGIDRSVANSTWMRETQKEGDGAGPSPSFTGLSRFATPEGPSHQDGPCRDHPNYSAASAWASTDTY
jgi:hypothetical protein